MGHFGVDAGHIGLYVLLIETPMGDQQMNNKTPTEMRDEARARMLAAKPGTKKWREAEEDLNFWQGRVAMSPALVS